MIVYLIGPRASGKTVVGGRLAIALGKDFVDTDAWMFARSGETVAQVVERHGWGEFRRRESEALRQSAFHGRVIATGGGMVLARENREFMREKGVVLYLCAPAGVLASRLAADPDAESRPSLTGVSVPEEMEGILAEREPLYREAAHHILDASRTAEEVVEQAMRCCNRNG